MDVDRRSNLREGPINECRSFGSNCHPSSQSRKMSIGVLVGSIANCESEHVKEAVMHTTGNATSSKGNHVKDPSVEKYATAMQKNVSPWVSTRSFNPKTTSSKAVNNVEHTIRVPSSSKTRPRTTRPKISPAAHSIKHFICKSPGLESDGGQKSFRKASRSIEAEKVKLAEHAENLAFSTKPGVVQEKEAVEVLNEKGAVEDTHMKTGTEGRDTLKKKLWDILGNISSPNQQSSQPATMGSKSVHPDKERDGKDGPDEKLNPNSDTIESDSERPDHTNKRPLTRSLTRKKAPTKFQYNKIEANKKTSQEKECPRGDRSKDFYNNVNDGSLPLQRNKSGEKAPTKFQYNKIEGNKRTCQENGHLARDQSKHLHDNVADGSLLLQRKKSERRDNGEEMRQGHEYENTEKRRESENDKIKSVPTVEKSILQRKNIVSANCSNERRGDVFVDSESGTKNKNSSESHLNTRKDQPRGVVESPNLKVRQEDEAYSFSKTKMDYVFDVNSPVRNDARVESKSGKKKNNSSASKPRDVVESPKLKNHQEDTAYSSLKNKINSAHLPQSPTFEINSPAGNSPVCSPKSDRGKFQFQSPDENTFNTKRFKSFKHLFPESTPCKSKEQAESSDDTEELEGSPLVKSKFVMGEERENKMDISSPDATDSESSEEVSHIRGHRKSDPSFPEIFTAEKFSHGPKKRPYNQKGVEVTQSSPMSDPFKGIQDDCETQMNTEQNQEDGLASAVALFTAALNRLKTKMKSIASKRSEEILRTAAEEIHLQLKNAESQINVDVGKLTNHNKLKRKRLETRFQEQQEKLLSIYKKFKEEFDLQIQNFSTTVEDLEEHEIELKGAVERQRATHKKFLLKVEQAIETQLNEAEGKITAVQESAQEKMLQLKLVVAECVKAFG